MHMRNDIATELLRRMLKPGNICREQEMEHKLVDYKFKK